MRGNVVADKRASSSRWLLSLSTAEVSPQAKMLLRLIIAIAQQQLSADASENGQSHCNHRQGNHMEIVSATRPIIVWSLLDCSVVRRWIQLLCEVKALALLDMHVPRGAVVWGLWLHFKYIPPHWFLGWEIDGATRLKICHMLGQIAHQNLHHPRNFTQNYPVSALKWFPIMFTSKTLKNQISGLGSDFCCLQDLLKVQHVSTRMLTNITILSKYHNPGKPW